MTLVGRTVLITGSARGIGAATARLARDEGGTVILHGRAPSAPLEALARELDADHITCEVADGEAVKDAVAAVAKRHERIDALVNCAGAVHAVPFLEATDADWMQELSTHLLGTAHVCQAVLPLMRRQGGGRIVNVASIRGHAQTSAPRGVAYSAAKAAVVSLTSSLAKEFAPDIAVNAVSPGFTKTDLSDTWPDSVWAQARSALFARVAEPREIAEVIVFLASERASFITGQSIVVDGGYTLAGK